MSKKEDPWVYFEGIEVPKKCTEKSYYIIFSKPPEIATKQGWIPISKTKDIVEADNMIEGKVMRWILEKNYDYPSGKTEVESAQTIVEVMRPVKEEAESKYKAEHTKMKKEYEGFVGDTPLVEVLKEIRDEIKHLIKILIENGPMFGRGL